MAKSVFFTHWGLPFEYLINSDVFLNERVCYRFPQWEWSKISQECAGPSCSFLVWHQNWLVVLTGINGTQICPVTLEDELRDESLVPRLRYQPSAYDHDWPETDKTFLSLELHSLSVAPGTCVWMEITWALPSPWTSSCASDTSALLSCRGVKMCYHPSRTCTGELI